MKKTDFTLRVAQILLALGTAAVLIAAVATIRVSSSSEASQVEAVIAPATQSPMVMLSEPMVPSKQKIDLVTLNAENTVVMDEAYDDQSVTRVMTELQALSDRAPKGATLYLVLNSPGGSVPAGQALLSFAKGLPQEVKTLTIFAASMGFQTVQGLGERLILDTGTLMSHRARFGVQGQGPGEIFSRIRYIMSMVDALDAVAASRMRMSFDEYRQLVHDEYWVFGSQAVKDKAADRVVLARCDKSLNGSRVSTVETMFGAVQVERPKCPLMPGILSVKASASASEPGRAVEAAKQMFTDKEGFFREYVSTGKYN